LQTHTHTHTHTPPPPNTHTLSHTHTDSHTHSHVHTHAHAQIHAAGLRHVRPDRRINEWKAPTRRTILKCATNGRQVAVAMNGGEIIYFELNAQVTTGNIFLFCSIYLYGSGGWHAQM
jgi:hypothetical protein